MWFELETLLNAIDMMSKFITQDIGLSQWLQPKHYLNGILFELGKLTVTFVVTAVKKPSSTKNVTGKKNKRKNNKRKKK